MRTWAAPATLTPPWHPPVFLKSCDGKFVAIAAATDEQYKGICEAMGRPDLVNKYKDTFERLKAGECQGTLSISPSKWVGSSNVDNLVELAKKHHFAIAQVEDDYEITHDEWRQERGSVIVFTDEMYGKLMLPGPSAMLSKTPGRIKWLARPLGYHNRYILKTMLGYSDEEITATGEGACHR